MATEPVAAQIDSIRQMGRNMAAAPMRDMEELMSVLARLDLSAGAYGAFGLLGGALGQAFDEVKQAAQQYVAAKRAELSGIHDKAYDTANGYVDGDGSAARLAANLPGGGTT
ncbi:MAG: hypothetical protein HOW71_00860 [Nonomuraea sp.]|nr:hypothetical protein [Nonomuraea sp.]NUP60708.1 hypothetical protein [Nonomuraea sp.]NUT44064.1 hypothetical protein [Thermoactinospora sp.]